jgi:hypothetical protein
MSLKFWSEWAFYAFLGNENWKNIQYSIKFFSDLFELGYTYNRDVAKDEKTEFEKCGKL